MSKWQDHAEARLAVVGGGIQRRGTVTPADLYEFGAELASAAPSNVTTTVMVSHRRGAWLTLQVIVGDGSVLDSGEELADLSCELGDETASATLLAVTSVDWSVSETA